MKKFLGFLVCLLCVCSCGREQTLNPEHSEYTICNDGKCLILQNDSKVKKFVEYGGELIDPKKRRVFLTTKRNVSYKDICRTAWGEEKWVYIHQIEDNQAIRKTSSKKCFVREEFVKDAFSADVRWPLREIYFDEDYNIIRINIYSNVSFK